MPLILNGSGIRDITRVLLVSPNTVLKALREAASAAPEPPVPRRVRDLEVDEFWSFVGNKGRPRWTWYGLDRQRNRVVAVVNGQRTDRNCRRLMEKLSCCYVSHFHTDGWPSYRRQLPRERHSKGKGGTLRVERQHLNFRTRIKRLQRRTICFSKSDEMHDAAIKLFIHHSNMSQHQF